MGWQVCRLPKCKGAVLNSKVGLCKEHLYLEKLCMVKDCSSERSSSSMNDGSHLACTNADHLQILRDEHARVYEAITSKKARQTESRKKDKVSTSHVTKEDAKVSSTLKYSISRRFLPCVFVLVWSCGVVVNLSEMHSNEAFDGDQGVAALLVKTFEQLGSYPTFFFFDSSCRLYQWLLSAKRGVNESYERLRQLVCFVVDRFHFKEHRNTFCKKECNPFLFPDLTNPNGTPRFNSSIAKSTNSWLTAVSHIVRNVDEVQACLFCTVWWI
ncbi:hypothetical protein BDR26DRAFT_829004 [Obelidium mucronatum]|nr:hypothetical protein BDR26DRAFT_829001 [Obelidium mucronatum]KAI9323962.1 hypothetical protein BDR26DRAFT_829004 [Obelidium mucronatum]